mmetsp:Transcript_6666/g.16814  ORF Transcript_6666/g.16814 Transcript_6666/m.16814 type:complete len:343 (-) Transcript_6666:705-1733(-)
MQLQLAALHGLQRVRRHAVHAHVPLRLDARLDDVAGARAHTDHHRVRLAAHVQPLLLERLAHLEARLEARLAGELEAVLVERAVVVEHVHHGQVVALAAREIVRVVRRRHLHHAGALLHVDQLGVEHDRQLAPAERVHHELAVQVGVARVLRMHGHRTVGQHGLQTRGGDLEPLVAVGHRVQEVIHGAERVLLGLQLAVDQLPGHLEPRGPVHLHLVHLDLRERRVQRAAPVHQAVGTVDQTLLVHLHEGLGDGARTHLVHGERLTRPVQRTAQSAQLVADVAALGLLPLPHTLEELLAAQIVSRLVLLAHQRSLHHRLRGDAGVIRARHPQHFVSAHAVPA